MGPRVKVELYVRMKIADVDVWRLALGVDRSKLTLLIDVTSWKLYR